MTVRELLNEALESRVGGNKSEAARQLGITRQTLDHWLHGVYDPDLKYARAIADLTGETEAKVLAMMLSDRGIDPSIFEELATYAMGVYLSSLSPAAA